MDDTEIGSAVRSLATARLEWHEQRDLREVDGEITERVKGYRIVTGGQTGSDGSWEVADAETGEVLAEGVGLDSYRAAWQDSWLHEDRIAEDSYAQVDEPSGAFGLPTELAKALTEWVVDRPHEARQLLGLDGEPT